jgi:hypothetical protein
MLRQIRSEFKGLFFCDPQGLLRNADSTGRIFHEKTPGIEQALGLFDIVKPNELEGKVLTGSIAVRIRMKLPGLSNRGDRRSSS